MAKQVLDVGQCGFDHASIARLLQEKFGASVIAADGLDDAREYLRAASVDLVLVNRQLDADGADGLKIIRQLKADSQLAGIPVMLVSNYAEYQRQAITAGAEPGFGKRDLGTPETSRKLARFLAAATSKDSAT